MQQIIQFTQDYKKELITAIATTALFQLYRKKTQKKDDGAENQQLRKQFLKLRSEKFKQIRKKELALIPSEILNAQNTLIDEVKYLCGMTSRIQHVPHLINIRTLNYIPTIVSPLLGDNSDHEEKNRGKGYLPRESFVYKGSYVLSKNVYSSTRQLQSPIQWLLAGPRKHLYFQPSKVKAAIVTCGGLCPGLNVVIREIFINLTVHYGCSQVWGIPFGYQGIYSKTDPWIRLDMDEIRNIQFQGGTFLGSSRGGFQAEEMVKALMKKGINQLYVIGGDGTHRGIHALYKQLAKQQLQISIIGVPKTIDNDIPIIDKSFGFETSVSESIRAIRSAYVESIGAEYGIGLVRLMGRDAGFIAMDATNASRDVDLCLIPEARFDLYGEHGVLEFIHQKVQERKHLVIVVAEGAGAGIQDMGELVTNAVSVDESGNKKLSDIGSFLKKQIVNYSAKRGIHITLKYIDPTYMIRTVSANSHDIAMCSQLAASATHGAMAGFTGFTVGHVNGQVAMIPVSALEEKKNRVNIEGRPWQRLLAGTLQPSFLSDKSQKMMEKEQ